MQSLTNLKIKSQCLNFILVIFICITISLIRLFLLDIRFYKSGLQTFSGTVIDIKEENEKNTLIVKAKEKIQVSDYQKNTIKLGDIVSIKGKLKRPTNTRVFYTFRYADYLKSKNIFWLCMAQEIKIKKKNNFWFYQVKQKLNDYLRKQKNSPYLFAFILGDTSYLENQKEQFKQLGISHLFAISGMHIILISTILTYFLRKIFSHKITFFLVSIFLIFYLFLTGLSPSILRATFMYILSPILKSSSKLLFFLALLLICYNPYYLFHLGFLFSFTISFYLIQFQKQINKGKHYLKALWNISFIAFIASSTILIYQFYELNLMTIFNNFIFVPYVTFLLFPAAIIAFIFPYFSPIFTVIINFFNLLLEITLPLSFTIIFPHLPTIFYLIEGILSYIFLKCWYQKKYKVIIIILFLFFLHSFSMNLFGKASLTMLDVEQGDSILIQLSHNQGTILFDTGGILSFNEHRNSFLVETRTIPYLKSLGIKKIDYLVLTHGDYDHIGETETLLLKFPVRHIIMNSGHDNKEEKKLQIMAKNLEIPITKLSRGKIEMAGQTFYFLNSKKVKNENQDSLICYTKINNRNILLLADANKDEEKKLIFEYSLPKMDILKIGHHGSNTSTSEELLKKINPSIALISAGENNLFNHPDKEVIERLKKFKIPIYQTKEVGSVKIDLDSMNVTPFLSLGHATY